MKMQKVLVGGILMASCSGAVAQAVNEGNAPPIVLPPSCAPLKPPVIAPILPRDVQGQLQQDNNNTIQQAADIFSWQEFITLNWPNESDRRGVPDKQKKITGEGPRVWETYKEEYEVYLPRGRKPPNWNTWQQPPSNVPLDPRVRRLFRRHKIDDVVDSILQAAGTRPVPKPTLTDQHGNIVRYEIRMNQVMFDFIVENQLYNGLKQAAFGKVHFPPGSIITKAAWREITHAEAPRFLTTRALVCERGKDGQIDECDSEPTLMGLAGFHIMAKTKSAPQWIWSTFEQVDNVSGTHPSFYDPNKPDKPRNQQTREGTPNQITRVIPIPNQNPDCSKPHQAVDNIAALNASVQRALKQQHSPLHYYELINTQWPVPVKSSPVQPTTVFEVIPQVLANTTMESFVQNTSSCMGCHSRAGTLDVDRFSSADFTFTLNNALPKPRNPWNIPRPKKPKTEWDRLNWPLIKKGLHLVEHTYEAPETRPFVHAKLHCGSCHLNGGRDPAAAWWVGMTEKYDYPATTGLQKRINQCFNRSMNGKNLCDTDPTKDTCTTNAAMQAIITYMQWIDQQFPTRLAGTPANGFPQLQLLKGHANRGKKIFLQKCAVCHGADGQGRYYDGGKYYRPALWGPRSFNCQAGMAKPHTLAAFLRANMPYDARGQLTDQEAWDLAEFIDTKTRPNGD